MGIEYSPFGFSIARSPEMPEHLILCLSGQGDGTLSVVQLDVRTGESKRLVDIKQVELPPTNTGYPDPTPPTPSTRDDEPTPGGAQGQGGQVPNYVNGVWGTRRGSEDGADAYVTYGDLDIASIYSEVGPTPYQYRSAMDVAKLIASDHNGRMVAEREIARLMEAGRKLLLCYARLVGEKMHAEEKARGLRDFLEGMDEAADVFLDEDN